MFKLHDKVVYPGYGVALIDALVEKEVCGSSVCFLKLQFLYKDMIILVPVSADGSCPTIRPLNTKPQVGLVLEELKKEPRKMGSLDFTPSSWNKRNKLYQLKIQGGDLLEIARIYRDIMHTVRYKELSFGEKNLLELAEDLMLQEIRAACNMSAEQVYQELRAPFKQFVLNCDPALMSAGSRPAAL